MARRRGSSDGGNVMSGTQAGTWYGIPLNRSGQRAYDASRSQILSGSTDRRGGVAAWPTRTLPGGQVLGTGPSPHQDWRNAQILGGTSRAPWYTNTSQQARNDQLGSQILGGSTNRTGRGSGTSPIRTMSGGTPGVATMAATSSGGGGGGGGGWSAAHAAQRNAPLSTNNGMYTVQRGDTLWDISNRFSGNAQGWRDIYSANKGVIGGNPNLIMPGQQLRLGPSAPPKPPPAPPPPLIQQADKAPAMRPQAQAPTIAGTQAKAATTVQAKPPAGSQVLASNANMQILDRTPGGAIASNTGRAVEGVARDPAGDLRMAQYKALQSQRAGLGPAKQYTAGRGFA